MIVGNNFVFSAVPSSSVVEALRMSTFEIALHFSNQARDAHNKDSVLPVPVGDSKAALDD